MKYHPPTGAMGRMVGHDEPKTKELDYVVTLQLSDGSQSQFRFAELVEADFLPVCPACGAAVSQELLYEGQRRVYCPNPSCVQKCRQGAIGNSFEGALAKLKLMDQS